MRPMTGAGERAGRTARGRHASVGRLSDGGRVHGEPIANPTVPFLAFYNPFPRTQRHPCVGRFCDDGRRRRARSWGTHREPGVFLRPSSVHCLERNDTPAGEDSATAGAVVRHVMGDPSRTQLFSFLGFFTPFHRTQRHAGVGRLCDGGRRRRARSWGTHREPGVFLCGLLQSICSNATTRPRGKTLRRRALSSGTSWGTHREPNFFLSGLLHSISSNATTPMRGKILRRRAPSAGAFMGDPSRTRRVPLRPSSVHLLERNDTPAGEDSATAGAVVRHVMGGPSRTQLFSLLAFFTPFHRTQRHAGVGRCCDGGRRRRARSWGTHHEPDLFPLWPSSIHSGLHQSIVSNSRNAGGGRLCAGARPLPVAA